MQYYFFHLMSWPYLPDDFERTHDSAWVWVPNSLYDPARGHDLYRDYIDTLALADTLGFDGLCVNEHHQTAYGLMPSPNLIAAALTHRLAGPLTCCHLSPHAPGDANGGHPHPIGTHRHHP